MGTLPISAKIFCKRSKVAFMPYGAVLKDEHPTSNERTISGLDKVKFTVSSNFSIQPSMLDVHVFFNPSWAKTT